MIHVDHAGETMATRSGMGTKVTRSSIESPWVPAEALVDCKLWTEPALRRAIFHRPQPSAPIAGDETEPSFRNRARPCSGCGHGTSGRGSRDRGRPRARKDAGGGTPVGDARGIVALARRRS